MSNIKVLIVGASVAGPTAAYWFAKAGAQVTIIERFPELRKGGQNIDIRTVGVTVMRKTPGMEAAVRDKIVEIEGFQLVHENGKPIATMRATGNPDQQSLVSEYEIFRGDLARVLYDLTKDNERVKYVFGEQVASMQHKGDDGPITVEFVNGSPTSEYDLVVAADGATSRTRAIGFGCGVRDYINPLNCWAAYFSIKQDLLKGSKMAQATSAIGGRFVGVGPDPAGGNRIGMMFIHPKSDHDALLPFREAQKQGGDALKELVARRWQGAGWKTDDVLKGMMETDDFYASELVQVKAPSLSKGRFVLVGDAGYAAGTNGAGTSLAIAGAYLLAGEICKHKGDLAAGLRGYEERMKPMMKDMQVIPPGVPGIMAPQTRWGMQVRNVLLILVTWAMAFGGIFSGVFSWAAGLWASSFGTDKYGLPNYEWVA